MSKKGGEEGGKADLSHAADKDCPPRLDQMLEGKLHPNREEQEDDSSFGQNLHPMDILDEAKSVRAAQDTGD